MNECMTCSVGFRAPSISNMVSEYAESIAADIDQELRYEDPDLSYQADPAEISHDALVRIKSIIIERLETNKESISRWFGEYSSEPRSGIHPCPPQSEISVYAELLALLAPDGVISQSPASRFLFSRLDDTALLFVNGTSYTTSHEFAATVANNRDITLQQLQQCVSGDADQETLLDLYNNGCLLINE